MEGEIERILQGLPILNEECDNHRLTDDIDICEVYSRRLDEIIRILRILARTNPDVTRHVALLQEIFINHLTHFQNRIHYLEGPFTSSSRYRCSRLRNGNIGRPRFDIPEGMLWSLRSIGFRWVSIAKLLMVSERTLRRRRIELGWSVGESEFSDISDDDLDDVVRQIVSRTPNAGETMTFGALRGRGLYVQRHRVRQSINRVDPDGRALRRQRAIVRRIYNVPSPNFLWHLDGNHKLIRWRFVIHGCIDGYSRCITYLKCNTNNTGATVLQLFTEAVGVYNMPLRVRMDQGTENIEVARFILNYHGTQGNHVITGSSVHNQRIERLWRDLNENVTRCYRNLFYYMEENSILDSLSEKHFYALHYVYQPRINRSLQEFVLEWNNHGIRNQQRKSPMQLWVEGHFLNANSSSITVQNALLGIPLNPNEYGIDDEAPVGELQTENHVVVPRSSITLSPEAIEMLQLLVNPLADDGNHGIDLYRAALSIVSAGVQASTNQSN